MLTIDTHADSATELMALHNLSADPRLTPALAKKIVSDNAKALSAMSLGAAG